MYNQPSEPHDGYDQPYFDPSSQQSSTYSQQQYEQSGSGQQYERAYYGQQYEQQNSGQSAPFYGQQMPPYGQQVPLYAQQQQQYAYQVMGPQKDWLTTLLLCIFLGPLGIHRFYSGHIAIGLLQFFTGGGFGIWWIIDLILILADSYTDSYGRPLRR